MATTGRRRLAQTASNLLPVGLVVVGICFWSVPAAIIVTGLALLVDRVT